MGKDGVVSGKGKGAVRAVRLVGVVLAVMVAEARVMVALAVLSR